MLSLKNVSIAQGTKTLIEKINFSIFEKHRVGIVGSNGCGKTSLFEVIQGRLEPSAGEAQLAKGVRLASLAQEVRASSVSAIHYAISGDTELSRVMEKLNEAEQKEDYETVMECHNKLHALDGYSAEARAAKILNGLGFSAEEVYLPVKHFSGGWRMRLSLAKCLFTPSDLLLLDEPTNHLDMEAIIWLETFIKHYPGAVLMVSHDRDFLDNTVTHIAHIENQQFKLYTGNYSSFEMERAQRIALQNAQYKKQQMQIAHMMKFVDRFRAKASKAKQAQSRLRAIEKMETIKPIYEKSPYQFKFMPPAKMPNPMLTLKRVDLGYDNQVVIKQVSFNIMAGERIGLLGLNGVGKSTLIKGLRGELTPLRGSINRPSQLVIGYFAQHQVDYLPLEESPLSLLSRENSERENSESEGKLIAYLGSFGFNRDQSLSPVKQFSGGEKARIALALIIWRRPNLLLLDEPTNHLDLEVRQALAFALQEYEGALLLVSHDRHLMRTLVNELYLVEGGTVKTFEGSVEDYQGRVDCSNGDSGL